MDAEGIIRSAQIFVDLILVVEYYPRKLNPHEKLCVYGMSFLMLFLYYFNLCLHLHRITLPYQLTFLSTIISEGSVILYNFDCFLYFNYSHN